jgi:hypothetical protein
VLAYQIITSVVVEKRDPAGMSLNRHVKRDICSLHHLQQLLCLNTNVGTTTEKQQNKKGIHGR